MSRRAERVAEALRRELSMFIHDEISDPRVGFITITNVKISDDLRNASVFYSVMGDERAKKSARAGLRSAQAYMKNEVGHRLGLKFIPEIRFTEDETMDYVQKIEDTIRKIHDEDKKDDSSDR